MRALNRVELIGRLGADPEVRYTQAGDAVATLSLATNEAWTDRSTGEAKEQTEWHRCVLWRRLAEIAGQHLAKGSRVYVAGSLRTRKWQDPSGQDRHTVEVQVRDLLLLDDREGQGRADERPAGRGNGRTAGMHPEHAASFAAQAPAGGDFDDDIPFAPLASSP